MRPAGSTWLGVDACGRVQDMSRALAAAAAAQVPSQEPDEAPPLPGAPPSPDDEASITSSSYEARVALTPEIAATPASSQTDTPTGYTHRADEGDSPVATPAPQMQHADPIAHAAPHATYRIARAPQTPPRPARVPQLSPPPPLPPLTPPTPLTPPAMDRMYDTPQCTAFGAALVTRPDTCRSRSWEIVNRAL
jgi:hypothetical protein